MIRVRLKAIVFDVDFRFSEATIWEQYKRSKQYAGELGKWEVYAFVNSPRTMMWLVHSDEHDVLRAERWRRKSAHWDDLMLADYCAEAGIELVGIKTFREHLSAAKQAKQEGTPNKPAWQVKARQ